MRGKVRVGKRRAGNERAGKERAGSVYRVAPIKDMGGVGWLVERKGRDRVKNLGIHVYEYLLFIYFFYTVDTLECS